MSTSPPPEESAPHVHNDDDTQGGATHTVLSMLEQATSRDGRPDSTPASTMLGTAHNMLHRFTSSSPSTPHIHTTQSPEALLDAAAANAAPTVLGTAQSVFSRLAHATHHHHATPAPQAQKPVPDVPRYSEPSSPTELPQQPTADSTAQGQGSRSVSSRGGGGGEERANTPPRGVARVTRSYPALPDATHPSRPVRVSHAQRRTTGTYVDSELAWHAPSEHKDTVRLFPEDEFIAIMSG